MGHCVEKLPHNKCGSSNGLQVFENDGKYDGYCFSCDTIVSDPYGDSPPKSTPTKPSRTDKEIKEELKYISSLPTVDIPSRKLEQEYLEYFGVKVALSQSDGVTPAILYYPYYDLYTNKLIGYKAKLLATKQIWWVGYKNDTKAFFGWSQAIKTGASNLIITEGEDDTVALYQALRKRGSNTKYSHLHPAVVSLSNGSSSAKKCVSQHRNQIENVFKELVLAFDMDEAGDAAVRKVHESWPTAKRAELPAKDANECVMIGRSKALASSVLFRAATPKTSRIVDAGDLIEAGKKVPKFGLSTPWPSLTDLMRGFRPGETIYIGAGVKMGKSEICTDLATHFILEHKMPIFFAKPEEEPEFTMKRITGKIAGRTFTDPKVEFDLEAYENAARKLIGNMKVLSVYQQLRWKDLREDIIMASEEGCGAIFIDPITNLTNGISSSDANTVLQEIAEDLSIISKDRSLITFIFCHLNAPKDSTPHELGGRVYSNQFAGSRAMMRSCHYMLSLEGNKDPDRDPIDLCKRDLVILEDRPFNENVRIPLFFDRATTRYIEV